VPKEVSVEDMSTALSKERIIGFDTETKPAFKPGQKYSPALIQLASSRAVYLVQMRLVRRLKTLQDLLENPSLKVGVGISEDLRRLLPYFNLRGKNKGAQFVDLTLLAKQKGVPAASLRALTAELLQRRLSKSAQLTNWANPDLTFQQIRYAALDAWISREIYLKLEGK